jgi:hypothetical protein
MKLYDVVECVHPRKSEADEGSTTSRRNTRRSRRMNLSTTGKSNPLASNGNSTPLLLLLLLLPSLLLLLLYRSAVRYNMSVDAISLLSGTRSYRRRHCPHLGRTQTGTHSAPRPHIKAPGVFRQSAGYY